VHREKLVDYLTSLSLYVFIPFFTAVGLQLNLPVLLNALGFSVLASVVRAACMAGGTVIGGAKAGLAEDKARRLWLGLLPQAGVSLGLAGIIGHQFRDTFGSDFQATCIGKRDVTNVLDSCCDLNVCLL
jgi:Kef-type K+ transport system membrane component KefB